MTEGIPKFLFLSAIALLPWVIALGKLVLGVDPRSAPPSEILELSQLSQWDWKVIWQLVMLTFFIVLLFLRSNIPPKRRPAWVVGLILIWPIVSVYFAWQISINHLKCRGLSRDSPV